MAGHSHAKNVMNKKSAMDKKKAKIFTKIAKLISIAVKQGESNNPDFNPRLRLVLRMAQNANVPKDIVKKALDSGSSSDKPFEEVLYEGYIEGSAIMALAYTDNKNKTAPEIRLIFNKANGTIAAPNSVSYMFNKIAKIECEFEKEQAENFFLEMAALGSIEVKENIAIFPPEELHSAQIEIEKNWKIVLAELTYEPSIYSNQGNLEKIEKLIEALEENESIQACWHNYRA